MATDKAAEKAREFLEIADQFKLGRLTTETTHPRDRDLSDTAKSDIPAALGLLFDVDNDVVAKYREWSQSGAPLRIGRAVARQLSQGGKIFFTGCGATGRLSIQLTAIWRDFWKKLGSSGEVASDQATGWEKRAFSVMAGGDFALIKSVEGFEDYAQFGKKQIEELGVSAGDVVFAITEGGETSFVIGTAWKGLEAGAEVFFVYNNPDDLLREHVKRSREVIDEPRIQKINLTTGPMAITGSTRMQATSIQLCAMMTILEVIFEEIRQGLAGKTAAESQLTQIPARFLRALEEAHSTLCTTEVRQQVARLIEQEEKVYRSRKRNNYFADQLAIDVLTDTTERSPTFCIPAFKKFDDRQAAESWSFLFLPQADTESAWRSLLKRELQPVEWDKDTIRNLIGEPDLERQNRIMQTIRRQEILRFRIGMDGLPIREIRSGDSASAILTEEEILQLTAADGFYRQQLEKAHAAGGVTAVVVFARRAALEKVQQFLDSWSVPATRILVPVPENPLPLQGPVRVAAKMLLNALSTLTMVRLGRVMGNVMIWVVPSNLKLIDRATRYIQHFTNLEYEEACLLLHEAIDYVAPRMQAGKEYPSAVGLSVIVQRDKCSFEEAESRLLEELGS
jgi:N-acetylmuramic acid 6-phosphate etherase